MNPQEEIDGPSYSSFSLEDVTKEKLKLLALEQSPLTFQKFNNFNNCLICPKFNVGPVHTHLGTVEHNSVIKNEKPFKKLAIFHQFWLKQHESYQSNRNYFMPETSIKVRCLECNRCFVYNKISEHLSDHDRCTLSELSEKYVNEMNEMVVKMNYPTDINMMFYPNDLIKQVRKVDGLAVNTIQRQLQNTHCLICQRILIGTFATSHVMEHVNSPKHKAALQNSANIDALNAYHNFWKPQRTVLIQAKQMYLLPLDKDRATCLKCGISFLYDEIIYHIFTNCQQRTDSNIINAKFIINQEENEEEPHSSTQSAECSTSVISTEPTQPARIISTVTKLERNSDNTSYYTEPSQPARIISTVTKLERKCDNTTEPTQPARSISTVTKLERNSDNISYSAEPSQPARSISTLTKLERKSDNTSYSPEPTQPARSISTVTKSDNTSYSTEPTQPVRSINTVTKLERNSDNTSYSGRTLKFLYQMYLKSRIVKPSSYCIQTRSRTEIYCLLCKKHVIDKLSTHLQAGKHVRNCTSVRCLETLEQYHRFWMRQIDEKQLLQVRFNPDTIDSMICVSCNQQIPMSQVMEHPCLTLENVYHNYQVPKEYQDFTNTYNKDVFRIFFPLSERHVSKKILNTEIPLVVSFTSLAYCLLCHKKIYRCPKSWNKHLLGHTADIANIVAALPYVVQYHQFWQSQLPSNQIYLIHYVPLKCVKGHLVPYDQVFEHMEQCRVEKLEQVKKSLRNVLLPASPNNCARDSDDSAEESGTNSDGDLSESEGSMPSSTNAGINISSGFQDPSTSEPNVLELIDNLGKLDFNTERSDWNDYPEKRTDTVVHEEMEEDTSENNSEPLEYDMETINTVYPNYNNMNRSRRPTIYFMQKRSNIERYCLICETRIFGVPIDHTRGKRHTQNFENLNRQVLLESYHKFWMSLPPDKQLMQIYFNPNSETSFKCDICTRPVRHKDVLAHPCPSKCKKYDAYEVSEEYRKFEFEYSEKITKKFMSRIYVEISKSILNTEMPLLVHFGNRAACLLCGKRFYREAVLWHKHLLTHCSDLKTVHVRLAWVLEYHQFWTSLEPELQICMVHFIPVKPGFMRCANNHIVPLDEILQHLNKCKIAEWRKLKSILDKNQDDESSTTEQNCKESNSSSSVSNSNEDVPEIEDDESDGSIVYSESAGDDKEGASNDHKAKKQDFNTERSDRNAYPEKRNETTVDEDMDEDSSENNSRPLEYDIETINTVYPNYNNMNRSRRPTIYFMQKRSSLERYCLICETRIFRLPIDHSRGKRHNQNFESPSKQILLESYHKFWMSLPPDKQLLQIYFNPKTETSFKCDICKKVVQHKDVIAHPCPLKIRKYEVSEIYRKFEFEYNEIISKKFMGRIFVEISKSVLNTEIPLLIHFGKQGACLLCGKRLTVQAFFWQKHLLNHCSNMETVHVRLAWVMQYHQFWSSQEPELQICMIHFIPAKGDFMRCSNNHIVPISGIFQHLSTCKIPRWKQLLNILDGSSNAERRPEEEEEESSVSSSNEDEDDESEDGIVFSENADCKEGTSKDHKPVPVPATKNQKNKQGKKDKVLHKMVQSVKNPSSTNHLDLIPHRFQKQLANFNINSTKIICIVCGIGFDNNLASIINHIVNPVHLKSTGMQLRRHYRCEVCTKKFNSEGKWITHMKSLPHQQQTEKRAASSSCVLQEYECLTCRLILYCDEAQMKDHEEQKKTKRKPTIVLDPRVLNLFKDPNSTQQQALNMREEILKNEAKDAQLVYDCLRGFESALRSTFPDCKAYPFGSRMTGIGALNSDLDVFVDMGSMYFDNTGQVVQQELVLKVKKILMENKKSFSEIVAIVNARTPIIRVVHNATDIDCDLSFRHGLSVENTRFIKFCFDIQPISRLAMLVLKQWAEMVRLKEEITSYAFCMMFIFYMQTNGYLLSVCELRKLTTEDVPIIDGWKIVKFGPNSAEELRQHIKIYEGTVFELLLGFFRMYTEFDFTKKVVCPLLGTTINVKHFNNPGKLLPPEMELLVLKAKTQPDCKFKVSAMCIQDPFDLAHNLTKAIFPSYRDKFTTLCSLTYGHMKSVF